MKRSKFELYAMVAGLGAAGLLCTVASAAPAQSTPYTVLEDTMVYEDMGLWFGSLDGRLYLKDVVMTAFDHASDARLTGKVTLKFSAMWEGEAQLGPLWSSVLLENDGGTWEGWCIGKREFVGSGPDIRSSFEGTMEGKGAYEGLIARYFYDGINVADLLILPGKGYVVERGAGYRPLKGSATRTQEAEIVPGAFFVPGQPGMTPGYIIDWSIVEESGVKTHLGKTSNAGFGFYYPLPFPDDAGRGMGWDTAANGDRVVWVVEADHTVEGQTDAWVHMAGGTGRFDAAVGWFHTLFTEPTVPPAPVMEIDYSYIGSGEIRY